MKSADDTAAAELAHRMAADLLADPEHAAMAGERVLHCWENGPRTGDLDWFSNVDDVGSTCLLLDGHDGPHEFTPDSDITVSFRSEETP